MCIGRRPSDVGVKPLIQFERTKPFHEENINSIEISETGEKLLSPIKSSEEIQYVEDVLATATYYTKVILFALGDYYNSFRNSICYKILTSTVQPAHFITAMAVISIAFLMLPSKTPSTISPIWTLVYLGSFSAHFGAQIWMTFISGLALYFALPRHTFGDVQQVLFPKYFLLNSALSLITLAIFLKVKNNELNTLEIAVQAISMSVCFIVELIIRLYLTPPLLTLVTIKTRIERSAGVGMEIGRLEPGNLLNCPHYLKIHRAFRKVHMSIAIGNVITMACTMLHLYYLSQRFCVLAL